MSLTSIQAAFAAGRYQSQQFRTGFDHLEMDRFEKDL
jgi:hypothetical protein